MVLAVAQCQSGIAEVGALVDQSNTSSSSKAATELDSGNDRQWRLSEHSEQ